MEWDEDSDQGLTPELFEAVTGVRFYVREESYYLSGSHYYMGGGAIVVMSTFGIPEMKLTANLQVNGYAHKHDLKQDRFWVKRSDFRGSIAGYILKDLKIFEATNRIAGAGYVEEYAEEWVFALCHEHTKGMKHRVQCEECRAELERKYAFDHTNVTARETITRLKNYTP